MMLLASQGPGSRGLALFAVLVVVLLGVAVVASTAGDAFAGARISRQDETTLRARLAARSTLDRMLAQLVGQREVLLAGGVPELDAGAWSRDGLEVRLRALEAPGGTFALSEAGLLPVHSFERGVFADDSGAAIDTAYVLLGMGDEGTPRLYTVSTWEPEFSAGVGGVAGIERERCDGVWTAGLRDVLSEVLAPDELERLEGVFESDGGAESRAVLVDRLIAAEIAPESWGGVLDRVRCAASVRGPGRVDIGRVPRDALAKLEGVDDELADALVAERSTLSADERASIAWPVARGIMEPETFRTLADHLTTRSLQWRVRVDVVRASPRDARRESGQDPEAQAPIAALEAVLDAGGAQPRLAWVRDVRATPEAWLAGDAGHRSGRESVDVVERSDAVITPPADEARSDGGLATEAGDRSAGLDAGGDPVTPSAEPNVRGRPPFARYAGVSRGVDSGVSR